MYIISLLTKRGLQWARSIWDANGPITSLLTAFTTQFHTLPFVSRRHKTTLITAYRQGLNSNLRQQMAIYNNVIGLEFHSAFHLDLPGTPGCTINPLSILCPPHHLSPLQHLNPCKSTFSTCQMRSINEGFFINCTYTMGQKDISCQRVQFDNHAQW